MILEERGEEDSFGSSDSTGKEGEEITIELLEEHWFFHNMLKNSSSGILQRPPLDASSSLDKGKEMVTRNPGEELLASTAKVPANSHRPGRSFLRKPSLPPRMGMEKPPPVEVCHLPKSISNRLQHSYSSVGRVTSIPKCEVQRSVTISACQVKQQPSSMSTQQEAPRQGPQLQEYGKNHRTYAKEENSRRAFQVKKWKSLSDLEDKEVQGFKDLGFVFDRDVLSPTVVNMIPGLREKRPDQEVRRPYLSEAWIAQRSAPPILDWVDPRSAADMKEQLKFWARVVASNVRQDC